MLIHCPTLHSAMERQLDSGKTKGVGVSNMTISKLQALMSECATPTRPPHTPSHP
jgi:diketogulonate reductase-like aldo/keto reductase